MCLSTFDVNARVLAAGGCVSVFSCDVRISLMPWLRVKGVNSFTLMLMFENVFKIGLVGPPRPGRRMAPPAVIERRVFGFGALVSPGASVCGVCGELFYKKGEKEIQRLCCFYRPVSSLAEWPCFLFSSSKASLATAQQQRSLRSR